MPGTSAPPPSPARVMTRGTSHAGWAALALLLAGCGQPPRGPLPSAPLARAEAAYLDWRHAEDRGRLLESLGADRSAEDLSLAELRQKAREALGELAERLRAAATLPLSGEDSVALATMATASGTAGDQAGSTDSATADAEPRCADPEPMGLEALTAWTMACYGMAANAIPVGRDTLTRLGVLGLLPRTESSGRRRELFLALTPVWQSVNRDNAPSSPYRRLLRLRVEAWGDSASPVEGKAPAYGLTTPAFEQWLERALARYRRLLPDTLLEPWDWYYHAGEASRTLSPRVARVADIHRVNDDFFRAIGANPATLGIRYDLTPRPGKYPVAFTDFGGRRPVEPWVFTSYADGGFDNLSELLHETGHAIHIAAIRTRPAFLDWPDNDTFTEALADFPALELYEPAWQWRYLGDSVPLAGSLRAKYAGIAFDMTWSLFEIRMHREPARDPNLLWSELAARHLGIRPHPELSWWAMRGQLIDSPGYLLNYALGAFIAADLRARLVAAGRSFGRADSTLYPWLGERLYGFGLARPSREVLEDFLGRPLSPQALLDDLGRITP